MALWLTHYNIIGRGTRRELLVEVALGADPARVVAENILQHEFAEVDLPVGKSIGEAIFSTLKEFAIVNVTYVPA